MPTPQQQRAPKTKYLKPQVFSISHAIRPSNPAHCRSLVDLNNFDTSAQKQNHYVDHFSSVVSNPQQQIKGLASNNSQKLNIQNKNNMGKNNQGNISNIAKILLQAGKQKINTDNKSSQSVSKINATLQSFNHVTNQPKKTEILADVVSQRMKKQARTASQTSLRQPTSSLPRQNPQAHPNLQSQKSQKSLKPALNPTNQPQHDYALLIKLKQYIEQLKQNEQKNLQQLDSLQQKNIVLQQQVTLLRDKIQVLQIRQKQMQKKIKNMQTMQKQNKEGKNDCQQHLLIIQSLRNVINQQMAKIIEMETYKVQVHQHRLRNKERDVEYRDTMQSEKDQDKDNMSRFHEVYSFKKKNNLNQSSIYIQDEGQGQAQSIQKSMPLRSQHKYRQSTQSIPQPYNELLKCLKSDSRAVRKQPQSSGSSQHQRNTDQYNENPSQISLNSSLKSQEQNQPLHHEYSNHYGYNSYKNQKEKRVENNRKPRKEKYEDESEDQQNNEIYENEQEYCQKQRKYQQQCSEDQILMEVGNYLQNIRRNVRQG